MTGPAAMLRAAASEPAPTPVGATRAVAHDRWASMAAVIDALGELARARPTPDPEHALGLALDIGAACAQVRAFLDAAESAAFAAAIDTYERAELEVFDARRPDAPATERRRAAAAARASAADEITLATGTPRRAVNQRVALAHDASGPGGTPGRGWSAFAALVDGRATLRQACDLVDDTHGLAAETVAQIVETCLAPTGTEVVMPDGTTVPVPVSQATFRRRLRRATARARGSAADAATRTRDALDERRISLDPLPDGVAQLSVSGATEQVAAAARHVDGLARGLRSGGDSRTLAQLRADIALDLLAGRPLSAAASSTGLATVAAVCGPESGSAPTLALGVTVSLETLLGINAEPGEITALPGVHADTLTLPAHRARHLALAAGGIWTRIVTDPLTGTAVDAASRYRVTPSQTSPQPASPVATPSRAKSTSPHSPMLAAASPTAPAPPEVSIDGAALRPPPSGSLAPTTRYRPSSAMARAVVARDNGCRAPGCSGGSAAPADLRPMPGRDLDHVEPYHLSHDTSTDNLQDLHRRCHNHKTRGHWSASCASARQGSAASGAEHLVRWRLPSGRVYVTRPNPYDRPPPGTPPAATSTTSAPDDRRHEPSRPPRDEFDADLRRAAGQPSDSATRAAPCRPRGWAAKHDDSSPPGAGPVDLPPF